jgi:hypothetical protein
MASSGLHAALGDPRGSRSVLSHNERCAAKALIAMRGAGGRVRVRVFANEFAEANWATTL